MWLTLLRYWKPIALVLLILGGSGWIYHKGREAAQQAAELQQLRQEQDALKSALKSAQEAAEAAQAARDRNDDVLPRVRRETAGRVSRAESASAAERLSDDQAAADAYQSAADQLRAIGTR